MVRDGAAGAGHGRRVPAALLDAGTAEEPETAQEGSVAGRRGTKSRHETGSACSSDGADLVLGG